MPHVVYLAAAILCPWPTCEFPIELIDFQLELSGDQGFYARIMADWGQRQDFGLIGRCPGCGRYVLFGLNDKRTVDDPLTLGLPVLPDDWHVNAYRV